MKYDPILCMNVPDSVKSNDKKTVDASFNVVYKSNTGTMQALVMAANEKEAEQKVRSREGSKFVSLIGVRKMSDSNTLDKAIKNCDEEYKMKVTSYVINKGQSGEYYGLKNKETNQVLYSAPNNWKSREGAKRWAEKKGMIYED